MEQFNARPLGRTMKKEEPALSLSEFREQYMSRVLDLVDGDLNQAAATLRVPELNVAFVRERA